MSLLSLVRMRPISICSWSFCLAWLTLCGVANAATLTLAWNRNPEPDIAGYVVQWGTQPGVYTSSSNVGNVTTQQVTGLADATVYYFVVKAYNTAGLMSGYSSEVSGQTSGGALPVNYTNTSAAPAGVTGADFNGDSRPDLVWQNASWQAVVWYLGGSQGNVFQGWTWLSQAGDPGWRIVGARDFNGDGRPDLVWQNDSTWEVVVWYMGGSQGNSLLGWNRLASTDVAGWSVVGAGDFNGDGKPDLVWQNDGTREVVVWYMGGPQGNSFLGWNRLASTDVAGWSVVGADDFNGDGKPDLVWQNDGTWTVVVWYMGGPQGNSRLGSNGLASTDVAGWSVVGARDFNGDGKPDLVWQNDRTWEVVVWYMGGPQGNSFLSWNRLASTDVAGWRAIAR
jgi:FG-GAP-like repeat/Fibronectin type III domain